MGPADPPQLGLLTFAWRLALAALFVGINGFFVAAEFALVKVRRTQLHSLAEAGSRRARLAEQIHSRLDHYLSACQVGITLASLVLGWLAEPAVAELLLYLLSTFGVTIAHSSPMIHGVALATALTIVTVVHVVLGEQAPKIWAIANPQLASLRLAYPLRLFALVFRPFIWGINDLSNRLLKTAGITPESLSESSHSVDELKAIVAGAAQAGNISGRQLELAENVFGIMGLEVRHILVPRVAVEFLSLQNDPAENLRVIRESGHSRLPLCEKGLDSVIGIVHTKDVMASLVDGKEPDLVALKRNPLFVPDTQPLSRLIVRMQRTRSHCTIVLDEHGTAIGLAFLEDAIEEIVGPIEDEFDAVAPRVQQTERGVIEMAGSLALPEAADWLEMPDLGEEADTIGGHVVALLGRLPRQGDELDIGDYHVTVVEVTRRRIMKLRFERRSQESASQVAAGDGI